MSMLSDGCLRQSCLSNEENSATLVVLIIMREYVTQCNFMLLNVFFNGFWTKLKLARRHKLYQALAAHNKFHFFSIKR